MSVPHAPERSSGISPVNLFSARDRYSRLLSGSEEEMGPVNALQEMFKDLGES